MNKYVNATVILALLLITVHAMEAKAHSSGNRPFHKELSQRVFNAIDSTQAKCPTLLRKFKEAKRNNKRNLKRASKFYNPLTLIFRAFDI